MDTMSLLHEVFAKHQRVVLWVSGGKDSLTLMHLCQPWADRLILIHNAVDTGFPGVWENLHACAEAWGYTHLFRTTPPLTYDAYVARYGWPVEIVPSSMDGVLPTPYAGEYKASSWWHCTLTRQLYPLIAMTRLFQPDALLTGSRASDAPAFAAGGAVVDGTKDYGWTRYNPLHEWTSAEVYAYIHRHNIPLPPHYAHKRDATFEFPECRLCTWQPGYLLWLQKARPEEYDALMAKAGPTLHQLKQTLARFTPTLPGGDDA